MTCQSLCFFIVFYPGALTRLSTHDERCILKALAGNVGDNNGSQKCCLRASGLTFDLGAKYNEPQRAASPGWEGVAEEEPGLPEP